MPIDYSNPNFAGSQRDAITRALMNIAMPPPPTGMPGQYGATQSPQVPGVQGPIVPPAGGGLPQDPMSAGIPPQGQMGGMGQTGVQGPQAPGAPPQVMPQAPGMGRGGLPQGPMPKTPNLVGQPLPISQPGTVMPPDTGSQIRGY